MGCKKQSGSYAAEKPKGPKHGLHDEVQKAFEEGEILINNDAIGVREMAQWLKKLLILLEDPGLTLSPHTVAHNFL